MDRLRIHRGLHIPKLKHDRDFLVWLPSDYSFTNDHYPVLYMHDGQNLIDPATAFLGVPWHIETTLDKLARQKKIREPIVVGIYNTPDRLKEYAAGEMAHFYAEGVIQYLKPLIDSEYRTLGDRSNTAIAGSSMGGLSSFFFAWHYPEIFSKAACISSSFFWRNAKMLYDVQVYHGPKKDLQIYLDVGGKERSLIPSFDAMTELLMEKGYVPGKDLMVYKEARGDHNERSWGRRFAHPLKFLFGVPPKRSRRRA